MKLLYQHEVDYIKDKDSCFIITPKTGEIAVNVDQVSDIRKRTHHFQDHEEENSEDLLIVHNNPWNEKEFPEYIFEPEKLHSDILTIYDFWAYWRI